MIGSYVYFNSNTLFHLPEYGKCIKLLDFTQAPTKKTKFYNAMQFFLN